MYFTCFEIKSENSKKELIRVPEGVVVVPVRRIRATSVGEHEDGGGEGEGEGSEAEDEDEGVETT